MPSSCGRPKLRPWSSLEGSEGLIKYSVSIVCKTHHSGVVMACSGLGFPGEDGRSISFKRMESLKPCSVNLRSDSEKIKPLISSACSVPKLVQDVEVSKCETTPPPAHPGTHKHTRTHHEPLTKRRHKASAHANAHATSQSPPQAHRLKSLRFWWRMREGKPTNPREQVGKGVKKRGET